MSKKKPVSDKPVEIPTTVIVDRIFETERLFRESLDQIEKSKMFFKCDVLTFKGYRQIIARSTQYPFTVKTVFPDALEPRLNTDLVKSETKTIDSCPKSVEKIA